jgi:hypothetical protein
MSYANGVITENPEAYRAQIALCREAGKPIINRDNTMLHDAYSRMVAEQIKAELKAKAKAAFITIGLTQLEAILNVKQLGSREGIRIQMHNA